MSRPRRSLSVRDFKVLSASASLLSRWFWKHFSKEKTVKPTTCWGINANVLQVHLMEHRCSWQVGSTGVRQRSIFIRCVCALQRLYTTGWRCSVCSVSDLCAHVCVQDVCLIFQPFTLACAPASLCCIHNKTHMVCFHFEMSFLTVEIIGFIFNYHVLILWWLTFNQDNNWVAMLWINPSSRR